MIGSEGGSKRRDETGNQSKNEELTKSKLNARTNSSFEHFDVIIREKTSSSFLLLLKTYRQISSIIIIIIIR
jgi:hypothetical protein